jgi:uncharacterized protein
MINVLPASLSDLLTPQAYPHPVQAIEVIETHMSWVLLTGEYAYKIKRPVQYAFVDMRTLGQRAHFCGEELRLNARFAPDLYLDVCAIVTTAEGRLQVNGRGIIVEYAVRMRQFSREDELDRLLDAGQIGLAELDRFGQSLAVIHAGMPVVSPQQVFGQPDRVAAELLKNHDECLQVLASSESAAACAALRLPLEAKIAATRPWLEARRSQGRVRECHGDLHSRNIVHLRTGLTGFDCLEFEPAFRWVDVAEEVAMLLADLKSRGYHDHAHAFLSGYLTESGDYDACAGINLYEAHHALVRAKVAAISAHSITDARTRLRWQAECAQLLACAGRALGEHRPVVLLTCGLSGSGKTWLARQLAARLHLLHLRSDVERKRTMGLAPQVASHSLPGLGLYTADVSEALYQRLCEHCAAILRGGYSVVVDATFGSRHWRRLFQDLAARLAVPLYVIECRAPRATLLARIEQRQSQAHDPSEADANVLDWQSQHFGPIAADENLDIIVVDTAEAGIVDKVVAAI